MSDQTHKEIEGNRDKLQEVVRFVPTGYFVDYIPVKKIKRDYFDINDFDAVEQHLRHRFKRGQISQLYSEFNDHNVSEADIARFFEQKSYNIFHWVLIESSNSESFKFILDKFPREAFKRKLEDDNFSFLIRHLEGRAATEEYGLLTSEKRELECARFKFLLKIDPNGIQDFMQKNKNMAFMKPSIWEDYEIALQSFNATTTPHIIPPTP